MVTNFYPWQSAWRQLAPQLPTVGLEALAEALRTDTSELCQGTTHEGEGHVSLSEAAIVPDAWEDYWAQAPVACCALAYTGWKAGKATTLREVQDYFDRLKARPASLRAFTSWFDYTDMDVVRPALLAEVERELGRRLGLAVPALVPAEPALAN